MSISTDANIESSNLFSVRTMHLFTLCSFAIASPLLTAFSRQTVFIHDQQFRSLEIGAVLLILVLLIPTVVVLLDQLAQRLSRRAKGYGRNGIFTVLFGTIVLSFLRPYVANEWLLYAGLGGILALSIAIPASFLLTFLYVRTSWLKTWLTFASVGIVVFPVMFLLQFQAIVRAEKSFNGALAVKNPVPVVMVIFDEFSSVTLMNEQMEIDATRFPQFARLAGVSTWYRNMTTNHPRTDVAVPTLMSGVFPASPRSPLAAEYPGNLLQVIESTKSYDTTVFEPISRLSPEPIKHVRVVELGALGRCAELLHTLAAVYPRLIFASDTPIPWPTIPRAWFGVRDISAQKYVERQQLTEGVFNYPGSEDRRIQLEHFLRCLKESDRPRFCFLHTVFPHNPWCFMPSGDQYLTETSQWRFPTGSTGELNEDLHDDPPIVYRNQQRYRAQIGFVDRFVGQILDHLQEANILDRCLLVITADHGVSFRPGHSRRLPDADNLSEILSVPLFIKLPGQTVGEISDRNVESVDVMPTIADVLGIELPVPVDGSSVLSAPPRLRKTLYLDRNMTVIEPNVPQRVTAVKRQAALFGDRQLEQPAKESLSHPDWIGRPLSEFPIDIRNVPFVPLNPLKPGALWEQLEPLQTAACLVMGELKSADLPSPQADLVVVVDGTIVDTGTSYRTERTSLGFEFLLTESLVRSMAKDVELYLVDNSTGDIKLRPLLPITSDESDK